MVAFNARRLVCSEISVITSVTFPIFWAALPNLVTFSEVLSVWATASRVISLAFSEFPAISFTVTVISSVAEATVLTFVAACSMVAAIEFMLALISSAAVATVFDLDDRSPVPSVICLETPKSSFDLTLTPSALTVICRIIFSSFSMKTLNHLASLPTSSSLISSRRIVRSPSPCAMSFSRSETWVMGRITNMTIRRPTVNNMITPQTIPARVTISAVFFWTSSRAWSIPEMAVFAAALFCLPTKERRSLIWSRTFSFSSPNTLVILRELFRSNSEKRFSISFIWLSTAVLLTHSSTFPRSLPSNDIGLSMVNTESSLADAEMTRWYFFFSVPFSIYAMIFGFFLSR